MKDSPIAGLPDESRIDPRIRPECTTATDTAPPRVALLSNGRYSVVITAAGSGYSTWRGLDVTRWREDATRDCWGQFCYIRDPNEVDVGQPDMGAMVESAGREPARLELRAKTLVACGCSPRDVAADVELSLGRMDGLLDLIIKRAPTAELATLQKEFFKDVQAASGKAEVAKVAQAYLEGLQSYLKTHPGGTESADVMRQIMLLYESQGKKVEAEAWRERLKKVKEEKPTSLEFGKPGM